MRWERLRFRLDYCFRERSNTTDRIMNILTHSSSWKYVFFSFSFNVAIFLSTIIKSTSIVWAIFNVLFVFCFVCEKFLCVWSFFCFRSLSRHAMEFMAFVAASAGNSIDLFLSKSTSKEERTDAIASIKLHYLGTICIIYTQLQSTLMHSMNVSYLFELFPLKNNFDRDCTTIVCDAIKCSHNLHTSAVKMLFSFISKSLMWINSMNSTLSFSPSLSLAPSCIKRKNSNNQQIPLVCIRYSLFIRTSVLHSRH